jgi:hypothetical protein
MRLHRSAKPPRRAFASFVPQPLCRAGQVRGLIPKGNFRWSELPLPRAAGGGGLNFEQSMPIVCNASDHIAGRGVVRPKPRRARGVSPHTLLTCARDRTVQGTRASSMVCRRSQRRKKGHETDDHDRIVGRIDTVGRVCDGAGDRFHWRGVHRRSRYGGQPRRRPAPPQAAPPPRARPPVRAARTTMRVALPPAPTANSIRPATA